MQLTVGARIKLLRLVRLTSKCDVPVKTRGAGADTGP